MTVGRKSETWQHFEQNETWRRLRKIAERLGRRVTGNIQDAEDVAQTTLTAYGIVKEIIENPEAWVTQTAINTARDLVRARQRVTPTDPDQMQGGEYAAPVDEQNEIDRLVARIVLTEVLQKLPRQQQAALKLKYGAGLQRATIAKILGVTEETIKTHLKRGTMRLRGIAETLGTQEIPESARGHEGQTRPRDASGKLSDKPEQQG